MDENRFNGQNPSVNNHGQQQNPASQPEFSQERMHQIPEFSRNYQDTINKQIQNVPIKQSGQTVTSYADFVRKGGFDKPKNNLAGKISFSVVLLIVVIAAVLFLTVKNEKVLVCTLNDESKGIPISYKFYLTYINDDFDSIDFAFSANLNEVYDQTVDALKEQWEIEGKGLEGKGYRVKILDEDGVVSLTAEAKASNFDEDYIKDIVSFYDIEKAQQYFKKSSYDCKVNDGGK